MGRRVVRRIGMIDRERLRRALRRSALRSLTLWAIFKAMPRVIRRSALERERVVIEWRIAGRGDGRLDLRQLVIEDGKARVLVGDPRDADVALTLDLVTLVQLATGAAAGPAAFIRGEIGVEGDPWVAMRIRRIFGRR